MPIIKKFIKRLLNRTHAWLNNDLNLIIHAEAKVDISKKAAIVCGHIEVGKNSTLSIAEGCMITCSMIIGENCHVSIGKNVRISNTRFEINDHGYLQISDDCVFNAPPEFPAYIVITNGKCELGKHAIMQASMAVRFGGIFKMGTYSSINYNSDINCSEQIEIGEFCLISYDVCIYDTNSHSTDWRERRERIPFRAYEIKKPKTSPIIIGNDVWIGKGASILKGAKIGDRSIIGLGTLVPSADYAADSLIVLNKPNVIAMQIKP